MKLISSPDAANVFQGTFAFVFADDVVYEWDLGCLTAS